MSSRKRVAALRIALLVEEFTEAELREALDLLHGQVVLPQALAEYLATGDRRASQAGRKRRARDRTSVLDELRDTDPQRYALLHDFERGLQDGRLLPEPRAVREFGHQLSEEFRPAKSRRENVGKIIRLLVHRPLSEIDAAVEAAKAESLPPGSDYSRLFRAISEPPTDAGSEDNQVAGDEPS